MTYKTNNLQPNNEIAVDAYADSEHINADNLEENYAFNNLAYSEATSDDSTTNNSANVNNFEKISISELQNRYNINRHSLYARMAHLRITTYIVSSRAYLDAEQVRSMDELNRYLKSNKYLIHYPVPEPSGPKRELEEPTETITDYIGS